jgi:uncharacterized repeat protein (TIGR03806 family)
MLQDVVSRDAESSERSALSPAPLRRLRIAAKRICGVVTLVVVCGLRGPYAAPSDDAWEPPDKLSAYRLFTGNGATQQPVAGMLPYDLNTPLFSDYSAKYRFVRLPPGTSAKYHDTEAFEFPIGTIIAKTFAFHHDLRDLSKGQRLIETRLLIRKPDGWIGLPYIWNDEQTEATLEGIGGTRDVRWIHTDGKERTLNYIIPSKNQCMSCHENQRVMQPIGPKARHLNRDFTYADSTENQLARWTKAGILAGAPAPTESPRFPVWNDPKTGTLEQRARAYLEINCAHCHNPKGPARTSALDLMAAQTEPRLWGLGKPPIAAGRASGGRLFDIVPGKPDQSIMVYRMESTDPGVMMPELPRRLVDDEGVALIREWITRMNETGVSP